MTTSQFRDYALSFQGTEERPHFDRAAFKVVGKRIFATLHEVSRSVNIMLTPEGQKAFCEMGEGAIYPVPKKWGEMGATVFELENVADEVVQAALEMAYQAVLEKK